MTTVAQLIDYLQTLSPETTVRVAVAVDGNYSSYTSWEDLELPTKQESGEYWDCSDNIDYYGIISDPGSFVLHIGRT